MKLLNALLFAYLILFPFGQLTRLPFSLIMAPEIHVYLTDLIMFGLVSSWLVWKLIKKEKYVFPPLAKPIFLFSFFALLSLLFNTPRLSGREVIVAGLYLFRWLAYAGLYFVIFDFSKDLKQKKAFLTKFLFGIGVMVAIFGLVQYVLWPNLYPLKELDWDPHYFRLVSTFLDPGYTGIILVLTLILGIIFYFEEFEKKKWLVGFLVLLVYFALALTYSRSSYLAYLVGLGVIAWQKKLPKLFIGGVIIGFLTLLILPYPVGEGGNLSRGYSIEARIENWQQTIKIAQDHPLFGIGFNAYRYAQRDYGFLEKEKWQMTHAGAGADSSLLFVLATTGAVGLFSYLWLWWRILLTSYFRLRIFPSGLGLAALSSGISVLVHSWFLNGLFYPWIMAWLWILLVKEHK